MLHDETHSHRGEVTNSQRGDEWRGARVPPSPDSQGRSPWAEVDHSGPRQGWPRGLSPAGSLSVSEPRHRCEKPEPCGEAAWRLCGRQPRLSPRPAASISWWPHK